MGVKLTGELLYNTDFFNRWVEEVLKGDFQVADSIVMEAIQMKQTFEDSEWPPAMAMMSMMFSLCIMAAQTGMDTRKFEAMLKDHMALMYDSAKFLIQHARNEWDEVLKAEAEGAIVNARR